MEKGNRTGKNAKKVCAAAAITAMMHSGAKWVLYVPIYNSDVVFPEVAMVDSIIAYTNSRTRVTNIMTKNHPLYQNETQSKFFNALIFSLNFFMFLFRKRGNVNLRVKIRWGLMIDFLCF